jgi:hypothetical protein
LSGGDGALSGVGNKGIFANVPGLLAVTYVGPNFLSVAAGAAMVDGLYYENDAAISCTVTSATAGKVRDDRLVIRKYFNTTLQNARLVLLPGSEVASPGPGTPPALTQDTTRTTYWDMPLARVSIADDGVITLTDEREYCTPAMLEVIARQGDDTSLDWNIGGTDDIVPPISTGGIAIQVGTAKWTGAAAIGGIMFVNIPIHFSGACIALVTPVHTLDLAPTNSIGVHAYATDQTIGIQWACTDGVTTFTEVWFYWLAIGPK